MKETPHASYYITIAGGSIVGFITVLLLIYFLITGMMFPIGFQSVGYNAATPIIFFGYIIFDLAFIFKSAQLMKKNHSLRKGSLIAIIAGILGGLNLFVIVGGMIGLIESFSIKPK